MRLSIFLSVFGIAFLLVVLLLYLNGRKNSGTFKCDGCGKRYPLSDGEEYYVLENEIMCKSCYWAIKAPYKIEVEE